MVEKQSKVEQIKQGLAFARNTANQMSVTGIENCKALTLIFNNLSIFLDMLDRGEVEIVDKTITE